MNYVSVCSGIEAATVAWHPLGWRAVAFSEIEKFPCAVLAHHYPETPNLGDMTQFQRWPYAAVDVLVGGTPCQSFSVAGLRKGLADPRGNLMLTYLAIAARYRPEWLVWENVPGVLSSNGGRDFGALLGGLAELGYGFAYRVLDAQHFGVPQRRRRVFVIGCLGNWRRAAAVLFERHSLQGHPAPRREAREGTTGAIVARAGRNGGASNQDVDSNTTGPIELATAVRAKGGTGHNDFESETFIAFSCKDHGADAADTAPTLRAMGHSGSHANAGGQVAVAFQSSQSGVRTDDVHATLDSNNGSRRHNGAIHGSAVRRLTPRECERLQGFPDDYTLIQVRGKHAADGPRYKALGNSMAVPVMHWLGERIQSVSAIA